MRKSIQIFLLLPSLIFANAFAQNIETQGGFYKFEKKWGSYGTGDGQFAGGPSVVTVTSDGYLYAGDYESVHKFDSNGNFILKWGSYGTDDGQFLSIDGIAIDDIGNVYVADCTYWHPWMNRVQKFDSNGNFLLTWGRLGGDDGQFGQIFGIAVDGNGNVYVVDEGYENLRIQKFDSNGNFLLSWGINGSAVAVDSSGLIYVGDGPSHKIKQYDSNGNVLLEWNDIYQSEDFAIDSEKKFYCIRFGIIHKFDSSGNFLLKCGSVGVEDGQFNSPDGIAVDSIGNLYVADTGNHRIQKFVPKGGYRAMSPSSNQNPSAQISSTVQRPGEAIIDIDYKVIDQDDATVKVGMLAFSNGTIAWANLIQMKTFLDGTEANLGSGIATAVTKRVTWDAGTDWGTDLGQVKFAVFAQDSRPNIMDLHFIQIPALRGNPAFKINRIQLNDTDYLRAFLSMIAFGDSSISYAGGVVKGVNAPYTNLQLYPVQDAARTLGFLAAKLGVRPATAAEIALAREGLTAGSVTQWPPRFTNSDGNPTKVNELNFDSSATGTRWFVKED